MNTLEKNRLAIIMYVMLNSIQVLLIVIDDKELTGDEELRAKYAHRVLEDAHDIYIRDDFYASISDLFSCLKVLTGILDTKKLNNEQSDAVKIVDLATHECESSIKSIKDDFKD